MASLGGGPAEKFGNEFERLWLTRLLLDVVTGRAISVRIEPQVPIELKTECIVVRPDGKLECHQCKRENGCAGKWTIASLESEGIISAARLFLNQSSLHSYYFVSGDRVPCLTTFRQRAIKFDRISELLVELATNQPDRNELASLTSLLGLDIALLADQFKLLDFLLRAITVCEDTEQQRARVEELATCHITGEPATIIAALEGLASTTVRREFRIHDLKLHLANHGFQLRDLTKQSNLPLLLDECCDRFERSFQPYLIGGCAIGRDETGPLLAAIGSAATRMVLLHGHGGSGKSGVIYEALSRLRKDFVPCTIVRLDQDELGHTPLAFGANIGLPADPVSCLCIVAQGRPAVLFIDQLDAIRWTSQHSASSWDIISQLINLALAKPELTVVLACRTHDANDDPRIRAMIANLERQNAGVLKLEALPLSIDSLDLLLKRPIFSAHHLSTKQREILRSPQNLYLWQTVHSEPGANSFNSETDLCRVYWAWVRRELTPHQRDELNERLLPALIENSLTVGREFVPSDVRSKYNVIVDKLLSIGTLIANGPKQIRFSHQSYFDFVAAERLAAQLRNGKVLLNQWLLAHDSLFHRQQLRQLLEMLRDDDLTGFVGIAKSIVDHADIRFHLKQATLETIAAANAPTYKELVMLLEYQTMPRLWQHVYSLFHRHVGWFDLLHKRGIILEWALSNDEVCKNQSRWLMNVFVEQRSDVVHRIIGSMPMTDQTSMFETTLNWKSAGLLSPQMFRKYLELVRTDSKATTYADIKKLAVEKPRRAIVVFREFARRAFRSIAGAQEEAREDRTDHVIFDSADEMRRIAKNYPKTTWSRLSILLRDAANVRRAEKERRAQTGVYAAYESRRSLSRLSRLIEELMIVAGANIAKRSPETAWKLFLPYLSAKSVLEKRVGLGSTVGFNKKYADRVLKLIGDDPKLLGCGATGHASRFGAAATFPACRVIRRFGMNASSFTLAAIETAIRSFVPKKEREIWRYAHEYFSVYPRTIFASQYVLLNSFPLARMSDPTRDWYGVLCRKFGPAESILKEPPTSFGGFVSSTIAEDRVLGLSDRRWLQIIKKTPPSNSRQHFSRRGMSLRRSSPEMFSSQLQRAAHRHPARFARLAMKIPLTAPPDYIAAIFRALGEVNPPANAPPGWVAANAALIEPVMTQFAIMGSDREIAVALGWMLNNRAAEPWSNDAINQLSEIALSHPNPESTNATVFVGGGGSRESKPDFVATAINSARGVAAVAVSSLLWTDKARLTVLQSTIKAFERDMHPSVRIAATRVAVPMLNIDKSEAVRLFLSLNSHPNDDVLLGRELAEFIGYTLLNHFDELKPVLERMIASTTEEVAKRGSEWATLTYLHTGKMKTAVAMCLGGSVSQRVGVASILSRELAAGRCDDTTLNWTTALLDDADESVRRTIAITFCRSDFYLRPYAHRIFADFIRSPAFSANIGDALHGLKETTVPLTRFADLIDKIVSRLGDAVMTIGGSTGMSSHYLSDVLLRLYEQSESDPAIRRKCLDALDRALEDRLGYNMTKAVDD